MDTLRHFITALRDALSPETMEQSEERYLAAAVDHADLERRIAAQARAFLALSPAGTGR